LIRSTNGIGLSGAVVVTSRLNCNVVPSNIHPPLLQAEAISTGFPSRTRSAFADQSQSRTPPKWMTYWKNEAKKEATSAVAANSPAS
jgi:hypothetical protein